MNGHLSDHQIKNYSQRQLSPKDLLLADQHLAECSECRHKATQNFAGPPVLDNLFTDLDNAAAEELQHLAYEQLEGFVEGSLSDTDFEIAESHLEICSECSSVERDLRKIRDGLETEIAHQPKIIWWKTAAVVSAIAASFIIVSAVAVLPLRNRVSTLEAKVLGLQIEKAKLEDQSRFAGSKVEELQKQLASLQQGKSQLQVKEGNSEIVISPEGRVGIVKHLQPEQQKVIAMALSDRKLQIPESISDLIGQKGQLMGTGEFQSFSLVSPVGTIVEQERPTFKWSKLKDADSYFVSVFDSEFKLIEKSSALKTNEWKISSVLQRGKSYAWQVVAMRNGQEIKSPMPPSPPAMFRVLEASKSKDLQSARQGVDSHLILGILNAQFGLLDDAQQEFESASKTSSDNDLPRYFLKQIQAVREK